FGLFHGSAFGDSIAGQEATGGTSVLIGYLIGLVVEGRGRERRDAELARARLEELADLRGRVAQAEKLASLGQLSSVVAHEVRNPLAILRAMTQNLAEELGSGAGAIAGAGCVDMLEEIDRLSSVTSRLVDFARPVVLDRRTVEVEALVRRAVTLARSTAPVGLRFEMEGPPSAAVRVDADLIAQVLLGLVDNAVAASPVGGRIRLMWRARSTPSGEAVELRVEDEGPGVSAEVVDQIFEPFFTTRPDGHGLGLAVARHLVEAHGGTLDVVAGGGEEIVGGVFAVVLPGL
ncbi:MAG: ATP-binding protein, partial [Acidobacteriota bacterium]